MQLPACEKVEISDRMIPTGARTAYADFARKKSVGDTVLDNCFQANQSNGTYALKLEGNGGAQLSVKASARQFPYFQVFTPPHRESIALEPMSCNVDAFNNGQGLITLEPDKEWKAKMTVTLE
jgi:aldose 1-epimerase